MIRVSELLESRRVNWRALEELCSQMEGRSFRALGAEPVARFSALYRAACADLALADAYQLPHSTIHYLHQLVGRAHNQLYRSRTFAIATWGRQLLVDVPQRLFADGALRLAFCIFWGVFILSGVLAYNRPDFAQAVVGQEMMTQLGENFSRPIGAKNPAMRGIMVGFYIWNNAGIGLQCFAMGLLFGVGGLLITIRNAAFLGGVFGHMATVSQSENFFHFVTAHGPYELTAVVLASAAGMRLGFSLVDTGGWSRMASLRRAAVQAMPTMSAAVIMFFMAAMIEAFLSPSSAPYWTKAFVAVFSAGTLMVYFVLLGAPKD
jgi:uncharacterized membrane protein SpoIIM required for sporulation